MTRLLQAFLNRMTKVVTHSTNNPNPTEILAQNMDLTIMKL